MDVMQEFNGKIVFFTFHNWETNRQGGFHKFAEAFAERGHYVYFFSFPRAYYTFFKSKKSDERLNKEVFKKLSKGSHYTIGQGVLENITLPTLALPGVLYKFIPKKIRFLLQKTSFKNPNKFFKKKFKGAKYFVFESNEGIIFYQQIKKLFPKAKIYYRPSDPLIINKNIDSYVIECERLLIKEADAVFVVNQANFNSYLKHIPNFNTYTNIHILNNGVALDVFKKQYKKPEILENLKNTAIYVGARDIDWDMIVDAAKLDTTINYIIITPEKPNENFLYFSNLTTTNLFFINGIKPTEVPKYITNANVVIVPNPKDRYKFKNWGITAKYLQAIAAQKPIVAYHDGAYLEEYGIQPVFNVVDFVQKIKEALCHEKMNYGVDLQKKDWEYLKNKFYKKVIE